MFNLSAILTIKLLFVINVFSRLQWITVTRSYLILCWQLLTFLIVLIAHRSVVKFAISI